ncbi:MAG TPA: MFS transporter [Microbacteriaceae bacterium]|nr:MFS transporter [Microbacteriaceae bacterium]
MTPPHVVDPAITAAIPIVAERPPWSEMFVALKVRNYQLFASSNLVQNTGNWMQRIAMDWLVLQLTGSPTAVGITMAMQFTPMIFLGLFGGIVADRFPKRNLLVGTQSAAALLAALMAVLTLTGIVTVWDIWAVSALLGVVTVVDNPARQVFVNELVGPTYLRNAISINSSIFQLGGLVGPALAGVLIAVIGGGWMFTVNAVGCALVVTNLFRIRAGELYAAPVVPRGKGQLVEGLAYVLRKPPILWTIVMMALVAVFAQSMPVFLTSFANDVYHVGAGGYGMFNALVACGALAGALLSTRRATVRLRLTVSGGAVVGGTQLVAGLMPDEWSFVAVLVSFGLANLLFITAANQLVQMSSNMRVRGRVMALYILVWLGGQAVGGPVSGWAVETFGPHLAMALTGSVPLVCAGVIAASLARRGRLRVRLTLHHAVPRLGIVRRESRLAVSHPQSSPAGRRHTRRLRRRRPA